MTAAELLQKRVIVENLWPGCQFKVADILTQEKKGGYFVGGSDEYNGSIKVIEFDVYPYPYLMRPLNWWEDRSPEEMPEYVKVIDKTDAWRLTPKSVHKVKEFHGGYIELIGDFDRAYRPTEFIPCNESEYTSYIKNKTP